MESTLAVTKEELQEVLSASPFAKIYQMEIHSLGSGDCTLLLPFQKDLERPGGLVAGAVLMAAADVAMWLAIMTQLGKQAMTVTTELNTAFLRSAKQEDVTCQATILKLGKSSIYGVAECRDLAGKLLTHHTITYARISQ